MFNLDLGFLCLWLKPSPHEQHFGGFSRSKLNQSRHYGGVDQASDEGWEKTASVFLVGGNSIGDCRTLEFG